MNCKNIQELLKADYLDGVCTSTEERFIQDHLKICSSCQKLESELRSQQSLLKIAKRQEVPEHVWRNIRNAIVSERLSEENRIGRRFFATIKDLVFVRPPVFAMGSAFAVFLFILVVTGISIQKKEKVKTFDIVEYVLADNGENVLDDFGTNIEEYFL